MTLLAHASQEAHIFHIHEIVIGTVLIIIASLAIVYVSRPSK